MESERLFRRLSQSYPGRCKIFVKEQFRTPAKRSYELPIFRGVYLKKEWNKEENSE